MSQLKSISSFVAINILAGVFNYLFQIIAGRNLSVSDFSSFNEWFAFASLFAFGGGLLQNGANFYPVGRSSLIRQMTVYVVICSVVLWQVLAVDSNSMTFTLAFVILSIINGWLAGQSQVRLMFTAMASAGALLALTKIALAFFPSAETGSFTYIKIATVAFVPSILFLGAAQIFRQQDGTLQRKHTSHQALFSAGILTVAAAVVPQMDIIILSKTLDRGVFDQFIQASIFYKAVFFFFLIFAQWLLPQQVRQKQTFVGKHLFNFIPIALTLAGASLLTVVSGPVSTYIMNWDPVPPSSFVFLSCVNMSLLTWIFLLIQESCSKKILTSAFAATLALIALAFVQYLGAWSIFQYFAVNGFVLSVIVYFLLGRLKSLSQS